MGQVWRNGLFLQACREGRDRDGICGKSRFISRAYGLYRVCKTPESNMSLEGVGLALLLLGWQVYPAYLCENGGYHGYPGTSSA